MWQSIKMRNVQFSYLMIFLLTITREIHKHKLPTIVPSSRPHTLFYTQLHDGVALQTILLFSWLPVSFSKHGD